jgi:hypothetical protein
MGLIYKIMAILRLNTFNVSNTKTNNSHIGVFGLGSGQFLDSDPNPIFEGRPDPNKYSVPAKIET